MNTPAIDLNNFKNKTGLFFIVLSWFFLSNCIKEESTDYEAYLINQSGHRITVLPYKSGSVRADDTIRLALNDTFLLAEGSRRGLNNKGGFFSKYFSPNSDDSVIVVFDGIYQITHYVNQPVAPSNKSISYTAPRNICYSENYFYEYYDISKHARAQNYTYIFTKADYEYASR